MISDMTPPKSNEIPWKQLPGRKSFHRIRPGMLSAEGMRVQIKTRPVPYTEEKQRENYLVRFDRAYAVTKLAYELQDCREVPFLDLVELMAEAYTRVNPDAPIVGIMSEIRQAVEEVVYLDPLSLSGSF
jgi:hypothetical protein